MQFQSTRDPNIIVSSSEAILRGLAPDGGLFVPTAFPKAELEDWKSLSYPELAQKVLAGFLTDYDPAFLGEAAAATYGDTFAGKAGYVQKVHDGLYSLELWHGPTCAFKDYALQLMPKLLVQAKKNLGRTETTRILVATSGDTGKAALAGYAGLPGIEIEVFYPDAGTSEIQRLQMATQAGDNVSVYAVNGNFDDAQTGVKRVFGDASVAEELEKRNICLSSANSINWGRLVPQIVYYFYAYFRLVEQGNVAWGQPVDFCVPTGNFGDILAGYYAKQMGLPVGKLVCASNKNNVLTDFIKTGTYDARRTFYKTTSPSMDILISSNLERLIYRLTGENAEKCAELMKSLSEGGEYTITEEMKAQLGDFYGNFCSEEETANTISEIYKDSNYVIDTHTAVAAGVYKKYVSETDDHLPTVIASTASPYKFTRSVMDALGEDHKDLDDFGLVDALSALSKVPVPRAVEEIRTAPVLHDKVVDAVDMPAAVKEILNIK